MNNKELFQITRSKSCIPGRKLPSVPLKVHSIINQKIPTNCVFLSKPDQSSISQNPNSLWQECSLFNEYLLLKKQNLEGVYVIPSFRNSFVWFGLLIIKSGHYKGGVFRFSLHFPLFFPNNQSPEIKFNFPLYHPSIDPSSFSFDPGESFKIWIPNVSRVWQLLSYLRNSFVYLETNSPLNPTAAYDYNNDLILFKTKVFQSVNEFKKEIMKSKQENMEIMGKEKKVKDLGEKNQKEDEDQKKNQKDFYDRHYLKVTKLDDEIYRKLKKLILTNKDYPFFQ